MRAIASLTLTLLVIGLAIEAALRLGRWQAWAVVGVSVAILTLNDYANEKAPAP